MGDGERLVVEADLVGDFPGVARDGMDGRFWVENFMAVTLPRPARLFSPEVRRLVITVIGLLGVLAATLVAEPQPAPKAEVLPAG